MASGNKEFLRPADVARHLEVTTGRIYQLIAKGIIPATRIGGSIVIPREAWERWLDRQRDRALDSIEEQESKP